MNTSTKRTFNICNIDEACMYLKSAAAFNSTIYMKKEENYTMLENTLISHINTKDNFFFLNRDLGLDTSTKLQYSFRVLLEACVVDFLATIMPPAGEKENVSQFSMPAKMSVQYVRKFLRIKPSKYHPVEVKFTKSKLTLKFSVLDISTSGIAVKVPRAELLYEIGDMIDDMELLLTEQNHLKVSGQIRAVKDDRCGIKFINCTPEKQEMIAEYIDRRQLAEKIRAKTYRDVEKELMMLSKKN